MQADYVLGVRLTPPQRAALDSIVQHRADKSPLLPPSVSDVIRQMIIEESARLQADTATCQCDHCHQSIPSGEGEMLT